MTHDEIRDKVAKAISEATLDWGDEEAEIWDIHRSIATAALAAVREALREPSDEMALQGWLHLPRLHPSWSTEAMKGAYRAMLAASPLAAPQKETSA